MGDFIQVGSRAGEVVLFNKKEKVATLTPEQAMGLSRMGELLARAALDANNSRASGPTTKEMVDILCSVGMHYQNDEGDKGTWPRLANLVKVENEPYDTTYRKITIDAYNTLCLSLTGQKAQPDTGQQAVLRVDENGVVAEFHPPDEDEDEEEDDDDGALDLHFGDPV
jgi:hypothetical protein